MNDALKLVNLTKIFSTKSINNNKTENKIIAVNNLNLTIPHGSVYGFLGRNGAGKTTTLKMITGLSKPTDGEIYIYGNKIEFGKPASYKNIGFLPDVPEFYSFMTAREYLFLCGRLHKMSDNDIKNKIREIFELINFDKKRLKNKISTFSRGMKQKLGIAVALINSPDLIMLDEPTSALDPIGRKETINIINSLRGKYTVVFSTHILNDVERVCDRIALIEKGSLILDGSINDIKSKYSGLHSVLNVEIPANNKLILDKFLEAIKEFDFISYINSEEDENIKLSFKTSDRKKAGEILPKMIYENGLSLIKFEFEDANLEDIFISATSSIVSQEKEAVI
ncbi:MAG: ABC transporter ATP-binding protein [Oscillospiraceae bacterium]|nr:ABC transporter ATP-binding protein [Oscillospiraceae bacterium]